MSMSGTHRQRWLRALSGLAILLSTAAMAAASGSASAATSYLNPGQDITSRINTMQPGDTLVLNAGTHNRTVRIFNKNGRPDAWFTLRGPDSGVAKITATGFNNMFEIYNSSYWRIENLELDGLFVASDGIKGKTDTSADNDYMHHFVFERLNIHRFLNNCYSSHVTAWDITIRNCHFHDAQEVGLYMGNSNGYQPIMNFTFENNLVERTGNYNMEIKAQLPRVGVALGVTPGHEFDSWGWLIKDNVWMRDNTTVDAPRPNFLIDAAPMSGVGADDIATIEGNVVLANSYPSYPENGFQLSGNLRVLNNVIMNIQGSGTAGIRIGAHQNIYPRHVEIINNTVFILNGDSSGRCLSLFNLQSGYTQVVANNAFIRGNTAHTAVSRDGSGSVVYANNLIRGTGSLPGSISLNAYPLSQIFVNPVETPGLANLYPAAGSPLIGAGSSTYAPALDFNGVNRIRGGAAEVGAYEVYTPHNPGWQLAVGLKEHWKPGDIDGDGHVNVFDVLVIAESWNAQAGQPGYNEVADVDLDGAVNVFDIFVLAENWNL